MSSRSWSKPKSNVRSVCSPLWFLLICSIVQERAEIAVDAATQKILQPIYAARREAVKKLPRFWGTALAQHAQLAVYMAGQDDMKALTHLTDLWVEYDQVEPRAFTINFVSSVALCTFVVLDTREGILREPILLGQGPQKRVQIYSSCWCACSRHQCRRKRRIGRTRGV